MMTDKEERKFIIEFINYYHTLPALWDVNSKDYSNRTLKEHQNRLLLEQYQKRYPNAGRKAVAKKINTLRSNFKRELKRLRDLPQNANVNIRSLVSPLYYFNALRFIDTIEYPTKFRPNVSLPVTVNQQIEMPQPKKRKTEQTEPDEDPLLFAYEKRTEKPPPQQAPDVFENIAKIWGHKLSEMSRTQRILAEKLVNDIMFSGQLGLLHFSTSLSNLGNLSRNSTPSVRRNSENEDNSSLIKYEY